MRTVLCVVSGPRRRAVTRVVSAGAILESSPMNPYLSPPFCCALLQGQGSVPGWGCRSRALDRHRSVPGPNSKSSRLSRLSCLLRKTRLLLTLHTAKLGFEGHVSEAVLYVEPRLSGWPSTKRTLGVWVALVLDTLSVSPVRVRASSSRALSWTSWMLRTEG